MKKTEALHAMSGATLAPLTSGSMAADSSSGDAGRKITAAKARQSTLDQIVLDDSYFLSATNPTATADQYGLETLAMQVVQMPIIRMAKEQASHRFKIMAGKDVPAEAWRDWDEQMEEWVYHYVILALNSDPNYPKVLGHGYGPPHEWFGMKVPGCRGPGTAENPDNNYSFIPVNADSRLELYGKKSDPAIGDCPFHITSVLSQSFNVSEVEWRDMEFNPDGTFIITVGPDAANGRPNHLQTSLDSRYLFIRDSRVDWCQVPNAYRVKRLDPPTAPPLSVEHLAKVAARFIVDEVPANYWFKQMVSILDTNTLSEITVSANYGGMPSQKLVRGRLKLADDEAFVLTLGPGDAKYWVLILYDFWLMSGNFWSRQSTLNNTQSVANADGSTTCVFSIQDPGVHNWIDTLDLYEPLFMHRWRMLPQTPSGPGGDPWAKGELVKLKDLRSVLPAETKWMTPEERKQQLADRLAAFHLRHVV